MTEENVTARKCPKDGTVTQPLGRRSGTWRCPDRSRHLLDTGARRQGRLPWWAPVVMSVLLSLLATVVVRRLRRRPRTQTPF